MVGHKKTSSAKQADGLEIVRSASKETKNKFDILLKDALLRIDTLNNKDTSNINKSELIKVQKESDSKIIKQIFTADEDLISSKSSLHATLNSIENIAADTTNENYILEKYFTDSTTIQQDDKIFNLPPPENTFEFLKKPLPRPRTIQSNSQQSASIISKEIFNIKSPNTGASQLLQEIESLSAASTGTYTVAKDLENSISSSGTYTVDNKKKINIPVGDIVIHSSEQVNNVVQIVNQNKKETFNKSLDSRDEVTNIKVHKTSKEKNLNKKFRKNSGREQIIKITQQFNSDETIHNIELQELNRRHNNTKLKTPKPITFSDDEFEGAFVSEVTKQTFFEDVIGIVVYKTDKLLLDSLINHPCVKIHLVDLETGEYLKQSTNNTQYIYPLITKAYSLQEKRSLIPYWEELLIFEEDYNYFINYENKVIIFFEILDFISFNDASVKYRTEGSNSGWHKVAWAFLKPISNNGQLNTDQKLRLQLYKPKKLQIQKSNKDCLLHDWWSSGALKKYPSTIHVSVRKIKNTEGPVTSYSNLIKDANSIKDIHDDEQANNDTESRDENDKPKDAFSKIVQWSRTELQSCKIPNKIHANLPTSVKGCLMLKFSNNGLLLACAVVTLNKFPIFIYRVQHNSPLYCKFSGQEALIYDLQWSSDDKYLITASADRTVQVWNVYKEAYHPKQVLPHPSFVYSTLLKKSGNTINIFTGSYDHILRVWQAKKEIDSNYELCQELEAHEGYITSLCSPKDDNLFYSADSIGTIIEWMLSNEEWIIKRNFQLKELHYTIINSIILHPKSNRLVVFCSDSIIRLIDLPVGCIVQWYKGGTNFRSYMKGCISPCGNLIFSPSDDGCVYIWNTDTGILQASYIPFATKDKHVIPYCLHYHPFDHMLAISHYSEPYPVLLCTFHPTYTGSELRLKDLTRTVGHIQKYNKKLRTNTTAESDNRKGKTGTSIRILLDKMEEVIVKAKSEK